MIFPNKCYSEMSNYINRSGKFITHSLSFYFIPISGWFIILTLLNSVDDRPVERVRFSDEHGSLVQRESEQASRMFYDWILLNLTKSNYFTITQFVRSSLRLMAIAPVQLSVKRCVKRDSFHVSRIVSFKTTNGIMYRSAIVQLLTVGVIAHHSCSDFRLPKSLRLRKSGQGNMKIILQLLIFLIRRQGR